MTRFRIALSAVAGLVLAAGIAPAAQAALLPFTFNAGTIAGGTNTDYNVNELVLSSNSIVTQATASTQNEYGYAQLAYFGPGLQLPTGLNSSFGIYMTYTTTVSATSFTSGGPILSFNYQLYADPNFQDAYNATIGTPSFGTVTDNGAADTLLASGAIVGSGSAGFNGNGGPLFSVLASFNLTPAGTLVFTQPVPFYNFVFAAATGSQTGNATPLSDTQIAIVTPIDASFRIPEPSTLILFGSALIAFGALSGWRSRRKQQPKPI